MDDPKTRNMPLYIWSCTALNCRRIGCKSHVALLHKSFTCVSIESVRIPCLEEKAVALVDRQDKKQQDTRTFRCSVPAFQRSSVAALQWHDGRNVSSLATTFCEAHDAHMFRVKGKNTTLLAAAYKLCGSSSCHLHSWAPVTQRQEMGVILNRFNRILPSTLFHKIKDRLRHSLGLWKTQ